MRLAKLAITSQHRVRDDTIATGPDFAKGMHALLASADADQLTELIARANAALPDDDERKIHRDDVHMLRRLAGQPRTLSNSLLEHATERRSMGQRRGRVSPESGDTARWAERLAIALQALASGSAASQHDRK
jgi:hypothetical protein